jgi:hypothetical protein
MQTENLRFVLEQANDPRQKDPFAKAVKDSVEVGQVIPSVFRAKLEESGFRVLDDEKSAAEFGFASTKVLKRVLITDKKGDIIAMGASTDPGEAITAAALGWFREHPLAGAEVPAGAAVLPKPPVN